jgi:type IV pilus assembly protein PilA
METVNLPRLARVLRQAYASKKYGTETDGVEAGFTLIELMVVLLIMAILLAIAIPTFLGVKSGAQDRAIQSNLTNGLTSAKASYSNLGSYNSTLTSEVTSLNSAEPNITFQTAAATIGTNTVSVNVSGDGQELVLVGYSASGTCWAAVDNEGDTTSGTVVTNTPTSLGVVYSHWAQSSAACTAASIPASLTWGTQY